MFKIFIDFPLESIHFAYLHLWKALNRLGSSLPLVTVLISTQALVAPARQEIVCYPTKPPQKYGKATLEQETGQSENITLKLDHLQFRRPWTNFVDVGLFEDKRELYPTMPDSIHDSKSRFPTTTSP